MLKHRYSVRKGENEQQNKRNKWAKEKHKWEIKEELRPLARWQNIGIC